jgi:hypothetical protein
MVTIRYINQDLGGIEGRRENPQWIATALGVAGGLASSLIGGSKAEEAAREAESRQRIAENKENAWYTRRYNEDYLDTAAGQNLVRRAKDYARENWKKAAGAQAVAGGTDAATAMAKEAGNRMVGDTIANIAAADSQRKANVDAQHRAEERGFAQMDMQRANQRAQNITNAAQNASNAMMNAGAAIDSTRNLAGGSNKGVVAPTEANNLYSTMQADNGLAQLQGMEEEARRRAGLA